MAESDPVMGLVYNVEPVRSKDKAYIDVLSECTCELLRIAWNNENNPRELFGSLASLSSSSSSSLSLMVFRVISNTPITQGSELSEVLVELVIC